MCFLIAQVFIEVFFIQNSEFRCLLVCQCGGDFNGHRATILFEKAKCKYSYAVVSATAGAATATGGASRFGTKVFNAATI